MSTIDLIILGKIQEHKQSAYELVTLLDRQNINRWIKISSQGIYRNINILYEKGYLKGKKIREGNMPEKTVYSITEKGRKYFIKLIEDISGTFEYFFFNFNAVINNIEKVDTASANKYLGWIHDNINIHKDEFNRSYKEQKNKLPYYGKAILDLYHKIFNDVLIPWIDEFITTYKSIHKR